MARYKKAEFDKKKLIPIVAVAVLVLVGGAFYIFNRGVKLPDIYKYDDLTKYIELGNYKDVTFTKHEPTVTSEEVQAYIMDELRTKAGTKSVDKGTVTSDSKIIISYVGRIDGKEFDGGKGSDISVDMTKNTFIDGFQEGIIGHDVGETFDVAVTFPSDYMSEDVAGKDAVFTITVNSMQEDIVPEYTDEFIKENTEYNSISAYEEEVKKTLMNDKVLQAENDERTEVLEKIVSSSKLKNVPKKEFKLRYNYYVDTYKQTAKQNDVAFDKFLKKSMGMTEEEFNNSAKVWAEDFVKRELVFNQIARLENIKITNVAYGNYIDDIIKSSGMSRSEFEKQMGMTAAEFADKNNVYTSFLASKVMDKVMDYSIGR